MKAFSKMPIAEKKETVTATLERLNNYINMTLGTDFATKLWVERIDFFRTFYLKLLDQLNCSEYPAQQ